MADGRARGSRGRWAAVIGVCVVVAAMIAVLCLVGPRAPEPSTIDTSVSGLPEPLDPEPSSPPSGPTVGHRVGDVAPAFSLPTLDGERISLSDFRGRLVILDFWASWCVPCRLSMPTLEAMVGDLGEDVVLLGVSLDRSETDARTYVDAKGYTDLIPLYGSLGAARSVAGDYGVLGIPRTFVIDRQGIVRFAGHPNLLGRDLVESLL